jgi:putrescine aminotransferase
MDNKLIKSSEIETLNIETVWDLYRKYVNNSQVDLISTFGFGNDTVLYAEGMYIHTNNQKKILDFTGGIGVLNLGHNHPRILKIRKQFADKLKMEVHKNYFSPYIAALSHNIAYLLPEGLDISYFPNSGTEAVEGAIKLAYKFHDRKRNVILHSDISFHGKTIAALNLTGSEETSYYKFQKVLNTDKFKYNDIDSLKNAISKHKKNSECDIYAIIVEPMNASSLLSCSEEFLREARDLCDKEKIVLIFDEIYTGWCKTGKLFYFMNFENLIPDVLLSAKSLGGGKSSISSYTCKKNIFEKTYDNLRDATLHSTTYNGFGEETLTAIEAINIMIDEKYDDKSKEIGRYINNSLKIIHQKHNDLIEEIRGTGCLQGIVLKEKSLEKSFKYLSSALPISFFKDKQAFKKVLVSSIIYHLYEKYNILTFYGSNKGIPLKVAPSLIVDQSQVDYFIKSLDETLQYGMLNLVTKFIKNKFFRKI